jgi:hypothetical protein
MVNKLHSDVPNAVTSLEATQFPEKLPAMLANSLLVSRDHYCHPHPSTHPPTHNHSPTYPSTHSPTHPVTLTHPFTHSHTHPHAHTHSHSHRLTHAHAHTHTHAHTHAHSHTHSHAHTHTHLPRHLCFALTISLQTCKQQNTTKTVQTKLGSSKLPTLANYDPKTHPYNAVSFSVLKVVVFTETSHENRVAFLASP